MERQWKTPDFENSLLSDLTSQKIDIQVLHELSTKLVPFWNWLLIQDGEILPTNQ